MSLATVMFTARRVGRAARTPEGAMSRCVAAMVVAFAPWFFDVRGGLGAGLVLVLVLVVPAMDHFLAVTNQISRRSSVVRDNRRAGTAPSPDSCRSATSAQSLNLTLARSVLPDSHAVVAKGDLAPLSDDDLDELARLHGPGEVPPCRLCGSPHESGGQDLRWGGDWRVMALVESHRRLRDAAAGA